MGRKGQLEKRMGDFEEIFFHTENFLSPVNIVVRADGDSVKYFKKCVGSGDMLQFFDYGKKSKFVSEFNSLNIGGWKKHNFCGVSSLKRTWQLTIKFSDGKMICYSGNSYPCSFSALNSLLCTRLAL